LDRVTNFLATVLANGPISEAMSMIPAFLIQGDWCSTVRVTFFVEGRLESKICHIGTWQELECHCVREELWEILYDVDIPEDLCGTSVKANGL